ncbi:FAD-dependent oxidoreductase [Streptomyces poonensis]|uniref:FAD-binding domain-containing protein n=1 Tax=Streptomyces poonensis TaxID=68255 RepID=A0A918Q1M1_9ACTN|nr:FAD-dependent oxidoreductase [Streptomyces poonensis]GGZ30135.1 hypothetical protein GCM10010365_58260 [Streptomyces poonensis]
MHHDAASTAHVLVIGGSLAGLMAGIALARQGHEVILLERADRHRPSGAALSVSESALRTILGPEHAIRQLENVDESWQRWRSCDCRDGVERPCGPVRGSRRE